MEKYLPIGTVVTLKNKKVELMIIGYCKSITSHKVDNKDYVSCIYPLGLTDLNNLLLFNHEDIEKIIVSVNTDERFKKLNSILLNGE